MGSQRASWLRSLTRHRSLRLGVLAAIGYLVYRVLAAQPSDVEVVFHYGQARAGLQEACMRYLRGGEQLRRVVFRYAGGAAATQANRVRLPDGDYTVELDLTYAGDAPGRLGQTARPAPGGGQTVRVLRPLIIRGSGSVNVYLDDGT
jgi:hypothetical protein